MRRPCGWLSGDWAGQAILRCSPPKSAMSLRVPPSAATKRFSTSCVEISPRSICETRVDLHSRDARKLGEAERRLYLLPVRKRLFWAVP
jgi:hypothetical protein